MVAKMTVVESSRREEDQAAYYRHIQFLFQNHAFEFSP